MKLIWLTLLFFGILLIAVELVGDKHRRAERKVVYRYVPRTFSELQDNPVPVTQIFHKMFTNPSPWVAGLNEYDRRQQQKINDFFVSQG